MLLQEIHDARRGDTSASVLEDRLGMAGLWDFDEDNYRVFIQLLGRFQLLQSGRPLALPNGGKLGVILSILALHPDGVPRDSLLSSLWPDHDLQLAGQSLNSLVYSLRKLLSDQLGGATPLLCDGNSYRLNYEAGLAVDVDCFDRLVAHGDRYWREEDFSGALAVYNRALRLYRGDLCNVTDAQAVMKRERLRVCYLGLLVRLAEHYYSCGEYDSSLELAGRMLASDPCREDAHRLMMRCHVQRGERAQALRQYQLCAEILLSEFDAPPEAATASLYEQIRLTPTSA